MVPLLTHGVSIPTLEQQALIAALLLLAVLISKEIGDLVEDPRVRRLSMAARVILAPLMLVFVAGAGLMLAAALR